MHPAPSAPLTQAQRLGTGFRGSSRAAAAEAAAEPAGDTAAQAMLHRFRWLCSSTQWLTFRSQDRTASQRRRAEASGTS